MKVRRLSSRGMTGLLGRSAEFRVTDLRQAGIAMNIE